MTRGNNGWSFYIIIRLSLLHFFRITDVNGSAFLTRMKEIVVIRFPIIWLLFSKRLIYSLLQIGLRLLCKVK